VDYPVEAEDKVHPELVVTPDQAEQQVLRELLDHQEVKVHKDFPA